jgi:hypothetical protein
VPGDAEPDGDWLNDTTRVLIHAIAPREAAQLALRIAEQTDALVAKLPLERMAPRDEDSPIDPSRGEHRGEHLDEIEAALRARAAEHKATSGEAVADAGVCCTSAISPRPRRRRARERRNRAPCEARRDL